MPDIRSDTKPVFVRECTPQIGKSSYEVTTSNDQEKSRDAVIEDAGPAIVEVTEDEFVGTLLPQVPCSPKVLQKIIHWVKEESGEYSDGRWTAFKQDPQSYKIKEDQVFSRLGNIVNAIQRAVDACVGDDLQLKTRYISIPSKAPDCSQRYNLTRPDGCFVFNRPRSVGKAIPDWMDIALTGEFKKDENVTKKINDDIKKALWNIHHTMREDPVRTRAWSFTIENRTLRMWYAGRADIIVSRPVDFMTQPDYIIRLFLSFMYASEESMGWDPTIICDWNGNPAEEPQYKIKVQSAATKTSPSVVKWYRTTGLISAVGAEAIRGRGTRVWRVREILANGTLGKDTYVLKDAWVDSDRPFEGDVIAQIEAAAKKMEDPRDKEALLPCLLTPLVSGPVLLEDGEVDGTVGGRRRDRWYLPTHARFHLTQVSVSSTASPAPSTPKPKSRVRTPRVSKGRKSRSPRLSKARKSAMKRIVGDHRDPSTPQEPTGYIVYGQKTHYRIVFKEVCEVLHEITSLERVVFALIKACLALKSLHKLGWVHRDISSGNILLFEDQVKIADFEYAKQMDLPGKTCHDIRTGTEDFMAVEVRLREFRFVLTEGTAPPKEEMDLIDDMLELKARERIAPASPASPPRIHQKYTWFYNPLHDLESVYWIFKSFVTNKDIFCVRAPGGSTKQKDLATFVDETERERCRRLIHHWSLSRVLFSGRSGRDRFAYLQGVLAEFLREHPLHPAIEPLAGHLLEMRQALAAQYNFIEKNPLTIDHTSAGTVHTTFMRLLRESLYHLRRTPCDVHIRSLGPQVKAIPQSIRDEILAQDAKPKQKSTSVPSQGSKRSWEAAGDTLEHDSGRRSKSPRTSITQTSPNVDVLAAPVVPVNSKKTRTVRGKHADATEQSKSVPPPPTRVLRSHARKAAVASKVTPQSDAPRAPARAARPAAQRKGNQKATKNHEAVKAAAKVAEKVKSKTRKGR